MNLVVVSLVVYSLVVCFILYWVSFRIRFKVASVVVLFATVFFVWESLSTVMGWPTTENIREGEVLSVVVREPRGADRGAIFLWVGTEGVPRAYVIPYSEKNSKDAFAASQAIRGGGRVFTTGKPADDSDVPGVDYVVIQPKIEQKPSGAFDTNR